MGKLTEFELPESPVIRTQFNYDKCKAFTDTSKWESICVPFDGYSLAELLNRHQQGKLTDIKPKKPIYHDVDHSSPDLQKVMVADLHERELFMKQTQEEVKKRKAKASKTASARLREERPLSETELQQSRNEVPKGNERSEVKPVSKPTEQGG